jgi:hypothetical protein
LIRFQDIQHNFFKWFLIHNRLINRNSSFRLLFHRIEPIRFEWFFCR